MAQLRLKLFGPFQAELDDNQLKGFKSQKIRALLAYLAVERRRHSRDALAGLLWPDFPDAAARDNLRYGLTNLRSVIRDRQAQPAYLLISRDAVALNPEGDCLVDVLQFEQLLSLGASLEMIEQAVRLYTADFLEGFSVDGSPDFEEWLTYQRETLRRQYVEALGRLSADYEMAGDLTRALQVALHQIESDPYQEQGHRQVMRLLAERGQAAAAFQHYETCAARLRADLGVDPAGETRLLAEQIQRGEFPPARLARNAAESSTLADKGACPYRGLSIFREEDAPYFFGRDGYIQQLLEAVQTRPLVVVILGSSGSGKSSLVSAGLLPRLRAVPGWQMSVIRPSARPFYALAAGLIPWLAGDLGETERLLETSRLAEALSSGQVALEDAADRIISKQAGLDKLILFVDQFEELFTLCTDVDTQHRFIDVLLKGIPSDSQAGADQRLLILLTIRADFMDQALAYRPFADILQSSTQMLGPMNREEMRQAIERPAEMQGAYYEEGLVERILDDVGGEPGNLPLLEFALTLLWEQSPGAWLTHAAYEQIGRVQGALACYAERVYAELHEDQRESARRIFMQLVHPGAGTADTRRVAARTEFGVEDWPVVQTLADRRLVVTGRDETGSDTVEIIHEALISVWQRMQTWLESDRAFRAWQESLRGALSQWESAGREEGALLSGVGLSRAESWLGERAEEISALEMQYVHQSILCREAQRSRELETAQRLAKIERRSRRFLTALAAVLAVSALVAGALTFYSQQQRRQALRAYSSSLAANAQQALNDLDSSKALVIAMAANQINNPPVEAQRVLLAAAYAPGIRQKVALTDLSTGLQSAPSCFALSPNGAVLLVGFTDGRLAVIETSGLTLRTMFQAHTGRINDLDFLPSGAAVTVGDDRQVILWEIPNGKEIRRFGDGGGHSGGVRAVDASSEGKWIVSGGNAGGSLIAPGELILWDAQTGDELRRFSGHVNGLVDVQFSPDGMLIFSSSGDAEGFIAGEMANITSMGDLLVWDTVRGTVLYQVSGLGHDSAHLAVSPDGKVGLAGAYYEHLISVIDLQTGQVRGVLSGHINAVRAVAFTPDGRQALTASDDGSLILWDLSAFKPAMKFISGDGPVLSLVVTPDGLHAYALTANGKLLFLDLSDAALIKTLPGHGDMVWDIEFSPDGSRLLSCSGSPSPSVAVSDASIRYWDIASGKQLWRADLQVDVIYQIAVSPDGRYALSGDNFGILSVWNLQTGEEIREMDDHVTVTPPGPPKWIISLGINPDGTKALTGGMDGTLLYWDLESGKPLIEMHSEINDNWSLSVSPDGSTALSDAAIGGPILWDLSDGREILRLVRKDGSAEINGASGIAYNPDGQRVVTAGNDGTLIEWDLQTGKEIRRFGRHESLRTRVEISLDGKFMVTSGMDGLMQLWDLESGQWIRDYHLPSGTILFDFDLSPDGRWAATGSADNRILLWQISAPRIGELKTWIEENRSLRELTCKERESYQIEPLCKE